MVTIYYSCGCIDDREYTMRCTNHVGMKKIPRCKATIAIKMGYPIKCQLVDGHRPDVHQYTTHDHDIKVTWRD